MSKRQLVVIGIVLLAAVVLFTITSFRQEAQTSKPQQEEATVVQKGQVTEKEREYSKEYRKLYSDRKGQKLGELSEMGKRRGGKQEVGISIGIPTIPTIGNLTPITPAQFLGALSCKADAVVVGFVKGKSAHMTDDETFVYTEYEFSVKDVLKNNSTSSIAVNDTIQVTRPGGLVTLNDQVIRVEDKLYKPLETKGEYLLFLKFIPSVNGYVVSDVRGDFMLENNSFKPLFRTLLPEELENNNDSQSLLNNVRNSIPNGCSQEPTGGN